MKKQLLLLIAMVMSLTATVTAAEFTVGDFTYSVLAGGTPDVMGGLQITAYNGGPDVVIPNEEVDPETGNPRKVVSIAVTAFSANTTITSVSLGANIVNLSSITGKGCFDGCTSLTTVNTSRCTALTTIANMAFRNCSSLKTFVVPETVTKIGSQVFENCIALESVVLPQKLTSLSNYIFNGCSSLISVNMPSGLTSIGSSAFASCSSLKEIDLSNLSISQIQSSTFNGASSLEMIKLPSTVTVISKDAFKGTAIKCIISSDKPVDGGVNIPLAVTKLDPVAFQKCLDLVEVDLYDSNIETIIAGCFLDSPAIETFKFPKGFDLNKYSTSSTGYTLLNTMNALREVTLPDVQEVNIPASLFKGLTSLETVVMSEGAKVVSIGNSAFNGCVKFNPDAYITNDLVSIGNSGLAGTAITKFIYTSSLQTLGSNALNDCKQLISVESEQGCQVPAVEQYTFSGCTALERITLPESIKVVKTMCFKGCPALVYLDMGSTQLVTTAAAGLSNANMLNSSKNLEYVSLPETLEEIAQSTFSDQTKLTSIELPASLKTIGNQAFSNSGLETVNFPDNLVTIGNTAFNGCKKITSVIFPIGLESIGNSAFNSVPLEGALTIPGTVRTIGPSAFSGNNLSTIVIYAPEEENENTRAADATISISNSAFYSLASPSRLESVFTNYTTPPTIDKSVFSDKQYKSANLYVPTPELYKAAAGWENFGADHIVTGVGDVVTDAEEAFEVYNLQGVRVTKTTDRKLSDLPQGIYIVNGKKVAKK